MVAAAEVARLPAVWLPQPGPLPGWTVRAVCGIAVASWRGIPCWSPRVLEYLSSRLPRWRLVSWEYAGAQPRHTIVIGRAPGRRRSCRWCYLHRCEPVHRLSHRRSFILRQLAEFADRYRPRSPWTLAGPGQRCAVHRPPPGTALALGPQAASRRARQQVNPQFAGLARWHPQVSAHNQRAALTTGLRTRRHPG